MLIPRFNIYITHITQYLANSIQYHYNSLKYHKIPKCHVSITMISIF